MRPLEAPAGTALRRLTELRQLMLPDMNIVRFPKCFGGLRELRSSQPALFSSARLYRRAHALLAEFRFPLAMRQNIHVLLAPAAAAAAEEPEAEGGPRPQAPVAIQ